MKFHLSDLCSVHGRIERRVYVVYGLVLFAIKYNIDRLIAINLFGLDWSIIDYLNSRPEFARLSTDFTRLYLTLLLVALPFIWSGTSLTLRRLRDAALPLWLVSFFFIPFVNLLLFIALSLVPSREPAESGMLLSRTRFIPNTQKGKESFAIFIGSIATLPFVIAAIYAFRNYGVGLFMGIPFFTGFITTTIAGHESHLKWARALWLVTAALLVQAALIVALAVEGVICVAMAFPIAFVMAAFGMIFALSISKLRGRQPVAVNLYSVLLILPLWIALEGNDPQQPPTLEAITSIDIQATPEHVWKHVVEFSELPPPAELLFKTGIAYPIRARITGSGVGAVRTCEFSTGPFVEPITTWDEPRLLAFSVRSSPPPMKELSMWDIHPPHLDNFLISKHGQFRLIPLANGGTRLVGTTWYTHAIWPSAYWSMFSDYIIHSIHHRVLEHIKAEAEGGVESN